ncbi:MAG: hypothetical protein ABFS38_20000 [Bacteroidota bacterium]
MKTFNSTILILLIACFALSNANAQSPKEIIEDCVYVPPGVYNLPCLGEDVSLDLCFESMQVNSVIHEKYWVTIYGQTTGNVYTSTQVTNINMHSNNYTHNVIFFIRLDGKLFTRAHITVHYTEVDGELTADVNLEKVQCK